MKIKDIPTFEQLNKLNINAFEVSSDDETLSPEYNKENYYEEA